MAKFVTTSAAQAKRKASFSLSFPKLGLKLSYFLNEFPALCGGRVEPESKTTTEVNLLFQKKITESAKLSLCSDRTIPRWVRQQYLLSYMFGSINFSL